MVDAPGQDLTEAGASSNGGKNSTQLVEASQGPSPAGSNCTDTQPPGDFTCEQQKDYGKCSASWMISGNFCQKTCGRCSGAPSPSSSESSSYSSSTVSQSPPPPPSPAPLAPVAEAKAPAQAPAPAAPSLPPGLAAAIAALNPTAGYSAPTTQPPAPEAPMQAPAAPTTTQAQPPVPETMAPAPEAPPVAPAGPSLRPGLGAAIAALNPTAGYSALTTQPPALEAPMQTPAAPTTTQAQPPAPMQAPVTPTTQAQPPVQTSVAPRPLTSISTGTIVSTGSAMTQATSTAAPVPAPAPEAAPVPTPVPAPEAAPVNILAACTPGDLVGYLEAHSSTYSTLLSALQAANVTLPANVTVFLPTNAAFTNLLAALQLQPQDLLRNTSALQSILLYHVLAGAASPQQLISAGSLSTLLGPVLEFSAPTRPGSAASIQANFSIADASQPISLCGPPPVVAYPVDGVLLPGYSLSTLPPAPGANQGSTCAAPNAADALTVIPGAANFLDAANALGIMDMLNAPGLTVFVPQPSAITSLVQRLGATTLPAAAANATQATLLREILAYHVVNGSYPSSAFRDGLQFQPFNASQSPFFLYVTNGQDTLVSPGSEADFVQM